RRESNATTALRLDRMAASLASKNARNYRQMQVLRFLQTHCEALITRRPAGADRGAPSVAPPDERAALRTEARRGREAALDDRNAESRSDRDRQTGARRLRDRR